MKRLTLPALIACCALSGATLADEQLVAQMSECANQADNDARLACYDGLAAGLIATKQAKPAAPAPAKAEPDAVAETEEPEALTDSIGGGSFAEAAGETEKSYAGRVTSCKKSADRRWFYIFDNGQVWKQVDRRKRRHKSCEFDVVLTEDTFGYVMKIVGEDVEVRVDRRR